MMEPTFRLGEIWLAQRPGAGAAGTAFVPHVQIIHHRIRNRNTYLQLRHTSPLQLQRRPPMTSACIPHQLTVAMRSYPRRT